MELVERDAALQTLDDRLRSVALGTGQIALIAGEAVIGKTSVLKALTARCREAAVWCVCARIPMNRSTQRSHRRAFAIRRTASARERPRTRGRKSKPPRADLSDVEWSTKAIQLAHLGCVDIVVASMCTPGTDDAAGHAVDGLELTTDCSTSRVMALVAQGRLRVRRGDPGVAEVLDEALNLGLASNTLQRVASVRGARAEAAYARGDGNAVVAEAESGLILA
jgi:hypothetical protein